MKSKQLISPRSSGAKHLKDFPLSGLNSYKIDTSGLQEKAKQIQLLKNDLQTQISQYKTSQSMFYSQTTHLKQQNAELKGKIKKLESELKNVKTSNVHKDNKANSNTLNTLNNKIMQLQSQISKLENKIKKKDQYIEQLQEYKKMYEIQVENKNNIMNFYQTKLDAFKKDKTTLISKYQQKISVLGSGFQSIIPQGVNNNPKINNKVDTSKDVLNSPRKINNFGKQKQFQTQKTQEQSQNSRSNRNKKIIRNSRNTKNDEINDNQTPYKLLKTNSEQQLKYQTPKNLKGQINEISMSSESSLKRQSLKGNTINQGRTQLSKKTQASIKTIRSDNHFLSLVKNIFKNIRQHNLKSQDLKNFNTVRNFIAIASPTNSEINYLLNSFPFSPIDMDSDQMELCIDKMKKHLIKKYSTFSGNLIFELIIDKIQDFQIAYEVNSEDQGQIIAGLSSNQQDE